MANFFAQFQLGDLSLKLNLYSNNENNSTNYKRISRCLWPFFLDPFDVSTWNLHVVKMKDETQFSDMAEVFFRIKYDWSVCHDQSQFIIRSNNQLLFAPERILFSCMYLATWWHILNRGLCLHSAAVARKNSGFLFLGESGSGKSTVARISDDEGLNVIGEDRIFLLDKYASYQLAAGPHLNTTFINNSFARPELKAIFILHKDKKDKLSIINPQSTAKHLFAALIQNSVVNHLPEQLVKQAFESICEISKKIPAYKLHFRKSPDFWQLIDEQFPD